MENNHPSFVENGSLLLEAMANEKRLQIPDILARSEMSVGPLSEVVGLSQSALSQHLGKLRVAKLVSTRRDAQTIYYSCKSSSVHEILNLLTDMFGERAANAKVARASQMKFWA